MDRDESLRERADQLKKWRKSACGRSFRHSGSTADRMQAANNCVAVVESFENKAFYHGVVSLRQSFRHI
ncbi:MAG TPA: hypothetical protein VLI21_09745, partial [Casimicrobiaceae bacterium]|nr:hypothetical protein [Casimicrobiaceae bacterium]